MTDPEVINLESRILSCSKCGGIKFEIQISNGATGTERTATFICNKNHRIVLKDMPKLMVEEGG